METFFTLTISLLPLFVVVSMGYRFWSRRCVKLCPDEGFDHLIVDSGRHQHEPLKAA
jgi:hypothetical protein